MQEIVIPTISEVVNEQIREMIVTGILRPGAKINVDEMARQFQVSPTPIREALGKLEEERLVSRFPRTGWHVSKPSRTEFIFLHDFQKILEQAICERLLAVVKTIDFEKSRSINEAMACFVTTEQYDRILEENEKFHLSLYEFCPNKILLDTLKQAWNNLKWQRRIMITSKEYLDRYFCEHVEIIEALESEDTIRVRNAVERHFITGSLALHESFEEEVEKGRG